MNRLASGIIGTPGQFTHRCAMMILLVGIMVVAECLAGNGQIPLEYYAKLPRFADPMVSPDGNYLAATIPLNGQPLVVVQKLLKAGDDDPGPVVPISTGGLFLEWYHWANNDRLLIGVRKTDAFRGNLVNVNAVGTIGRDGKNPLFFKKEANDWGFYRQYARVVNFLEHDEEHILMELDDEPDKWANPRVHRLDVYSGKRTRVLGNRKGVYRWIADNDGEIRIGVKHHTRFQNTGVTIYYRESNDADWETLQKVDYFDHERLAPYRFDDEDRNILLVTGANLDDDNSFDEDAADLFRYDLTKREIVGPYVDEHRKKVIGIVKRAMPEMKVEIVSMDRSERVIFFKVYTDINPPQYFVLDLNTKNLVYIASEYPELDDRENAAMESVAYEARDGLEIPAFLTVPAGVDKKNLPTVVYPHGGPWARDRWGFDNYVQFFASRGYAVFQPQFRGSTGQSIEFEEAGYGEWGYAIQDDITDGVRWLIESGVSDPDRICIVGSSFGGYAAAMGAVRTPGLYRCAASTNGVLDLVKFTHDADKLLFENINEAMWNNLEEAKAASPSDMAERIMAPVLLIGSERDTVVPVEHSRRMYQKMKQLGKKVEYVELAGGEHWRTNEAHEVEKMRALERFLGRHLGVAKN